MLEQREPVPGTGVLILPGILQRNDSRITVTSNMKY
jgi:hypothetical protein